MDCNECEERPATLHFTQWIDGQMKEVHVCEVCAKRNGFSPQQDESYSLHDLLTGLFHMNYSNVQVGNEHFFKKRNSKACPTCHLSFEGFQESGKFGCADCYVTFKTQLDAIFKRVHSGNTKHIGKIPSCKKDIIHTKKKIAQYRKQLQELIEQEEFEQAAIIRDEIRKLEALKDGGIA